MNAPTKILAGLLATVTCALAVVPVASAPPPQIEDPAGDHPAPFMDLTAVSLRVAPGKGGPQLETTFTLAGTTGDAVRASMTGYSFTATVGKCDLLVRFIGYPDGAASSTGFPTAKCGANGRDVGGTFTLKDNTITVRSPLRDLKGVAVGQTMTKLAAFTMPLEGQYHDDNTIARRPAAAGDTASSNKPWVIG